MSTRIPSAVAVAITSLLATFLYIRAPVLYKFYANAPSRLQHINNLSDVEIKFRDVVRNCEDILLDTDAGFALLSCDPGRDTWNTVMGTFVDPKSPSSTGLYLWNYSSSTSQPEKLNLLDFPNTPEDFHPLGIDYHAATHTIYAANHAFSGTRIEMFRLSPVSKTATHTGTLRHPLLAAPNSIAALNAHELFVTNDHHFLRRFNPTLATLETYSALPGGSVVHISLHELLEPKVTLLARVPFANGVVQMNGGKLAVASSNANSVYLYNISRPAAGSAGAPSLAHTKTIRVPFHADNLSVDGSGKLLVAGHPHSPTVARNAVNNGRCNAPGSEDAEGCGGLSWIMEWSEEGGAQDLYVGDGFKTACTAARDVGRGVGVASGLYERGLLTWRV